MHTLAVSVRNTKGKNARKELEGDKKIPGVFYGRKEESTSIAVSKSEFLKLYKEAGESTIITLAGAGEDKDALINDVAFDPVTGQPIHVDFYVVEKDKKLTVDVPLEFVGEAPAVKDLGGILIKVMHELKIEALPKDLPHSISVDVSSLATLGAQIAVKDLTLPNGVTAKDNPEDVVALATEAKEEIEEPIVAPDLSAIEVEKKGKEETAEGEGEAAAPEKKE